MISVPLRTKLEQIFEIFIKKFGHFFFKFQIWTFSGTAAADQSRPIGFPVVNFYQKIDSISV